MTRHRIATVPDADTLFHSGSPPGLTVERSGDPIWNGRGIGLATGGVLGAVVGRRSCSVVTLDGVTTPALLFGALGAWLDHGHVGYTKVFVGPGPLMVRLMPLTSRRHQRLLVELEC